MRFLTTIVYCQHKILREQTFCMQRSKSTSQEITLIRTISCLSNLGAADLALAASRTGYCRDRLARSFTSSVMVALKSMVCRLRGARRRISEICSGIHQQSKGTADHLLKVCAFLAMEFLTCRSAVCKESSARRRNGTPCQIWPSWQLTFSHAKNYGYS